MTLEELDRPLVALGGRAGLERSQVAAATGARVLIPRVQPVLSRGQLTDHVAKNQQARCQETASPRHEMFH